MKWLDEYEAKLAVSTHKSPMGDHTVMSGRHLPFQDALKLIAAVRFAHAEMLGAAHAATQPEDGDATLSWIEGRMYGALAKLQSGEFPS